jgi:hypothetical protein
VLFAFYTIQFTVISTTYPFILTTDGPVSSNSVTGSSTSIRLCNGLRLSSPCPSVRPSVHPSMYLVSATPPNDLLDFYETLHICSTLPADVHEVELCPLLNFGQQPYSLVHICR